MQKIEKNNRATTNTKQENIKEWFTKYQSQIKSFISNKISNKDDADDILQDVFYQLIKAAEADPIENISAWLYKVAKNKIINAGIKKKEVEMPVYKDDDGDNFVFKDFSEIMFSEDESPEMEYLRSLVWKELENALSELPDEQREIFELTELDGIPVKEIAKTTGTPVNTLLSRKHYAILYLRKRLASLYDEIIND